MARLLTLQKNNKKNLKKMSNKLPELILCIPAFLLDIVLCRANSCLKRANNYLILSVKTP